VLQHDLERRKVASKAVEMDAICAFARSAGTWPVTTACLNCASSWPTVMSFIVRPADESRTRPAMRPPSAIATRIAWMPPSL